MRDIYLIDFENVASEGLSGITYLSPEDEVIIFYSNNSNRLSMKMHILIGKSVCKCNYFEVTVGGKNALDHQISTWLGYLIGTRAADRNYYIVSKDMGYKFVASFWTESAMHPSVRCIDNIRAAGRIGRSRAVKETEPEETALPAPEQTPAEIPAEPAAEPLPAEPVVSAPVPTELVAQEPQPEKPEPPEPTPTEEPPVQKARARRTFFGVVLPDWPEPAKAAEPAPVEEPAAEPAAEEAPAPAEEPAPTEEPVPEEEPAPVVESAGEWPPLEDKPDEEDDIPASRSRSRSRSRRSRSRSGRNGAQKETAEPVETAEPQPEPEQQPEKKTARREKKTAAKSVKPAEPKAEKKTESKAKPEKKTEKKPNISGLIAPYPGLQEAHLQQLIAENRKQVLCNTLRKQLGQEKGLALYNEIKKIAFK